MEMAFLFVIAHLSQVFPSNIFDARYQSTLDGTGIRCCGYLPARANTTRDDSSEARMYGLVVRTSPRTCISTILTRIYSGNGLIAVGSALTLVGLTWGGVHYPWGSVHVLVPLVVGVALMGAFFGYEVAFRHRKQPVQKASIRELTHSATLPLDILSNRTSAFASVSALYWIFTHSDAPLSYLATFCHGITSVSAICEFPVSPCHHQSQVGYSYLRVDYMPVFFQACKGASPVRSSVETLPIALVMAPFAMFSGIVIKVTRTYRPVNLLGWILSIVGFVVLTLLRPDSSTAQWVGFQFLMSTGNGIIVSPRTHVEQGVRLRSLTSTHQPYSRYLLPFL